MTKYILGIVAAVVLAGTIYGAYQYPQNQLLAGSAVGTTFSTAKVAQVNISPATQSATSSSVLNTDASDRFLEGNYFSSCTGVGTSQTNLTGTGLAALTISMATTSVSSLGSQGNTQLGVVTVSTSTAFSNNASTTINTDYRGDWASGTYLTFTFNATNTAACTVGVHYHAS